MNDNEVRYCERHDHWSNLWTYESELRRDICPDCNVDYWDGDWDGLD